MVDPTSLPPSKLVVTQAFHLPFSFGNEYDLVENLCATPTKLSLWELLQKSPTYHKSLQKALPTLPEPLANLDNISSFLDYMHAMLSPLRIVFTKDDLPPKEV